MENELKSPQGSAKGSQGSAKGSQGSAKGSQGSASPVGSEEAPPSLETINKAYMKHVLLAFITSKDQCIRSDLVKVIGKIFSFTDEEAKSFEEFELRQKATEKSPGLFSLFGLI